MDPAAKKVSVLRSLALAAVWVAATGALLWLAYAAWYGVAGLKLSNWQACAVLVGAGLVAGICLAQAIGVLDRPRDVEGAKWYVVYGLEIPRRVLMLGQIGCVCVMMFGAVHWYFGATIIPVWAQTAPATLPATLPATRGGHG